MPEENRNSWGSAIVSWQGAMVLAALFGFAYSPRPYSANRPEAPVQASISQNQNDTFFYSRLWEDPWQALTQAKEAKADEVTKQVPLPFQEVSQLSFPDDWTTIADVKEPRICILPVIVRGDLHSAEAFEMRTRFRIALLSGLGVCGYKPDQQDHVGLVRVPLWRAQEPPAIRPICAHGDQPASVGPVEGQPDGAGLARESPSSSRLVPFEWFTSTKFPRDQPRHYQSVLVLWIPDEMLFDYPLRQLDNLNHKFTCSLRERALASALKKAPKVDFKVIGPCWSGILADMLKELRQDPAATYGFPIYSSTATMADSLLEMLAGAEKPATPTVSSENSKALIGRAYLNDKLGNQFHTLCCTDDQLALDLLRELDARGVNPLDEDTRIAIISNWDTDYGRALPLTFASVLKQQCDRAAKSGRRPPAIESGAPPAVEDVTSVKTDLNSAWPKQILRVHYLSGLDGETESRKTGDESKARESRPATDPAERGEIETAEGTRQVDYIRRLATTLRSRIAENDTGGHPPGRLRAIGVMGSDVYDKLLILQALRPLFKDVIFFTSDLDARLIHPRVQPFTRNLVIASSFGFELFRSFQFGVPPFRDSYQTGVFLSVQSAMERCDSRCNGLHFCPQLFEIGRSRAVELLRPWDRIIDDTKEDITQNAPKWDGPLYPLVSDPGRVAGKDWSRNAGSVLKILLGAAALIGMLFMVFLGTFKIEPKNRHYLTAGLLVAIGLAIVGVFFLVYDYVEPLALREGVSLWPSELIRLVTILLAIWFLINSHRKIEADYAKLCEDFSFPRSKPHSRKFSRYLDDLGEILTHTAQPESEYLADLETLSMMPATPVRGEPARKIHSQSYQEYQHRRRGQSESRTASRGDEEKPTIQVVDSDALWLYFCEDGTPFKRYARAAVMTALYLAGCLLVLAVIGHPTIPFRGSFSEVCDGFLTFGAGIIALFLIFNVVSATHACKRFIEKLSTPCPTYWRGAWASEEMKPFRTLESSCYQEERTALREGLSYYFDTLLIGKLTTTATSLIYYPFIALTLLCLARWTYWAHWQWSPFLVVVYSADAAICVFCALLLRSQAVRAKKQALAEMDRCIAFAHANKSNDSKDDPADKVADALGYFRGRVAENQEGAFLPWAQQPVVSAILIPLGGTGVAQLLQTLLL